MSTFCCKTGILFGCVGALTSIVDAQTTITVTEGTTDGGLTSFTFSMDPNDQAGTFDTFALTIEADQGTTFEVAPFTSTNDALVLIGSDVSGFNVELTAPQFLGGLGLTFFLNPTGATYTPTLLEDGTMSSIGVGEDLPISESGALEIAQIVLPAGVTTGSGTYDFRTFLEGPIIEQVIGAFGSGSTPIPGDFDGDGDVDGADFGVFVAQFQIGDTGGPGASAPFTEADFNESGFVDGADFGVFVNGFQNFPPMEAVAVPEPSMITLVAFVVAGSIVSRQR